MNMPYQFAITALRKVADTQDLIISQDFPKPPDLEIKRQELEDAISLLKVSSFGGLTALVSLVRQWGADKGITGPNAKATVESQFEKLLEEVGEIRQGIMKADQHEIIDGIGDSTVVLILLAELAGVRFETCLLAAWDVIKDRQGTMVNGQFVKSNEPTSKPH